MGHEISQSLTDRDLQPNTENDDFIYVYFNQSNSLMFQDVLHVQDCSE